MSGNKIGDRGGLYFAQALQVNVALESLDLADTDLVGTQCVNYVVIFVCVLIRVTWHRIV